MNPFHIKIICEKTFFCISIALFCAAPLFLNALRLNKEINASCLYSSKIQQLIAFQMIFNKRFNKIDHNKMKCFRLYLALRMQFLHFTSMQSLDAYPKAFYHIYYYMKFACYWFKIKFSKQFYNIWLFLLKIYSSVVISPFETITNVDTLKYLFILFKKKILNFLVL